MGNSPPSLFPVGNLSGHGGSDPDVTGPPPGSIHEPRAVYWFASSQLLEGIEIVWRLEPLLDEQFVFPWLGKGVYRGTMTKPQ